ncbi:MAG: hypothetical protein CVV44_07460 [Spirochaetae bacterium HGW-Spirochaetae-1]|jgi:hypothetical protein|nr:MAG: hypothetical protein CVV44_07460 [Spirochaetae bacterium HGW-Spirochaetae-1]
MAEGAFSFQKFIDDSKNTLLKPKEYFASMEKEGGFGEPIIKAVLYGAVAGLLGLLWSVIGLSAVGGAMGGMFGGGVGIMVLVGALIFSVIGLFIGAVIILIISAICGGTTDFEANTRVSASLMVMYPISAVLGFAGGIHLYLGSIVSLLVSLYGLFLLYNALIGVLGGKEGTAKIISIILAVIPVLMLISALMCASAVKQSSDIWMKQSEDVMKQMDNKDAAEAMKRLEEFSKQMEKAAKEAEEK